MAQQQQQQQPPPPPPPPQQQQQQQQQQQPSRGSCATPAAQSNTNTDSSAINRNVDDITQQLDQMNVDQQQRSQLVDQHQRVNISIVQDTTNQDQQQVMMSIDDENVQPSTFQQQQQQQQQRMTTTTAARGESNILIVTNVDSIVFSDSLVKAKFESLFTAYDERVLFRYLKSFRRVRLDFTSSQAAELTRLNLNDYKLGNSVFKCYLAQMIRPNSNSNNNNNNSLDSMDASEQNQMFNQEQLHHNNIYLNIPKPHKQFLISPPVSPPCGWRPAEEASPCIDVQLISAIANLVPGQVHEIHPGNESQPGIFVEVCEEAQFEPQPRSAATTNTKRIPRTASPAARDYHAMDS